MSVLYPFSKISEKSILALQQSNPIRTMQPKTGSLGQLLRSQREEKKLSLSEVENATSIRLNFLEAIEEGTISQSISPVYAQGFIKQYAAYLGLDGESLLKEHSDILAKHNSKPQHFAYGIGTLEMRNHHGGAARGASSALWIAAFSGVLFAAWLLARYLEVF